MKDDPIDAFFVGKRDCELMTISSHWVLKVGIVGWWYDLLVRFILYLRWLRINTRTIARL